MRIIISSGHGKYIRGASGPPPIPPYCDEVDEARKIVEQVATELRELNVDVLTFHDDTSHDQSTNLSTIVNYHNKQTRDIDCSIHLNCYDGSAHGVEVLYVTQQELAARISAAIAAVGFTNRGAKYRSDLKFLNATHEPSVLLEVLFCDHRGDCETYRARFTEVCRAIAESLAGRQVQPGPEPPPITEQPPEAESGGHPQLSEGSEGPAVVELQSILGVPPDGDFGNITATQVEAFQRACGLTPDAVVGPQTWAAVDDLELKLADGSKRLSASLIEEITELAKDSPLDGYEWPDRGMSPPGYIAGMSLCYAVAVQDWHKGAAHAIAMARELGSSSVDALKWYESELKAQGCKLNIPEDRLRTLFVLMIGLSMRESSGRYPEGRDLSAGSSSTQADTCEAGLMQTSWNIRTADPSLPPLLIDYWDNPNGFRNEFAENVDPTADNLDVYGSGEGARYQFLAKFCPAFAVMTSGVGLRTRKDHWGPIKRLEVTINKEADALLKSVQALVDSVA
jgi:peptidoglycan hydrolase-like protein with peptidoglycan-binding domain